MTKSKEAYRDDLAPRKHRPAQRKSRPAVDPIKAVVQVGAGGRGFVVEDSQGNRLIVTAGHCLPSLPPCISYSYTKERTYERLLGKLGAEPTVWAECLFIDPISDIAVLGGPDGQVLYDEANRYQAFIDELTPLLISDVPAGGKAYLLSLQNQRFACTVRPTIHTLWISDANAEIVGGMSGSPIVDSHGRAIGVLCTSSNANFHGPNPRLVANLPGWLLKGTL
jgi:Trypsin-like peptidase domain